MKMALLALVLAAPLAPIAPQESPKQDPPAAPKEIVVKAANVKWTDHQGVPGAKVAVASGDPAKGPAVVLIKFPKGTNVPAHWHTANETVTVVSGSGTFGSGCTVDEAKGTELSSGSYIVIPGKLPHWVVVKEELVISVSMDKPIDFELCGEKK